jgi:cell division protein FtsL
VHAETLGTLLMLIFLCLVYYAVMLMHGAVHAWNVWTFTRVTRLDAGNHESERLRKERGAMGDASTVCSV